MIWGGVSFNTKTQCVQIRGNLNAARYRDEILNPVCIPHLRNNRRMALMHDGAPAHTARATQALLRHAGSTFYHGHPALQILIQSNIYGM